MKSVSAFIGFVALLVGILLMIDLSEGGVVKRITGSK